MKYVFLIIFMNFTCNDLYSQFFKRLLSSETDTNYIVDYSSELTTRIFGSQKYARFRLYDGELQEGLDYLPNDRFLVGIGANHGILGINLGFNFPFINNDDDRYGTTEYTNWTTHLIARKIFVDGILQYYKGYYLENSLDVIKSWPDDGTYMIRGDIRTFSVGLSVLYIFNNKKFSYRAGFIQNEWQKKSAGSFLAGGETYYHIMKGDSTMVPGNMKYPYFYEDYHFSRTDIFTIGPMVGYAHTFVLKQHWFMCLSLTANLSLGNSVLHPDDTYSENTKSGLTLNLNTVPRIAMGYNSPKWCFDISYNNMAQRNQAPIEQGWIQFDTGNFRFNIVHRFHLKKPVKILNPGLGKSS